MYSTLLSDPINPVKIFPYTVTATTYLKHHTYYFTLNSHHDKYKMESYHTLLKASFP